MQFAGGKLSNRLFHSSAARTSRRLWLSEPYIERDGERGSHVKLHFGAAYVSDELCPTILHTRTIAGVPGPSLSDAPSLR